MRIVTPLSLVLILTGCFNPALKVDGRTALEQQLTREAILRAVETVPLHRSVLEGPWRVEVVSPSGDDDAWTRTLLHERLVAHGADVAPAGSEKVSVVQATLLFAGSDVDSFAIGLPIPGTLGTSSIGFYHENVERGRAQVRLNFWDVEGGLIAQTAAALGTAHYGDYFLLTFFGPFSFTNLDDVKTYGRFIEKGEDAWRRLEDLDESDPDTSSHDSEWIAPETRKPR